ncbi:MAG: alpha-amylase [Myxococcales bacterium]|nr:alpha-amylase [Myxococcales bacterium]
MLGLAAATLGLSSCWGELEEDGIGTLRVGTHVEDWRDETIYQVLVDRFADGDTTNDLRIDRTALGRYQGGDWQGLTDRLDYIERLGVTTLWISPVVRNVDTDAGFDGYHGYWAQDLTLLNPHFGDLAALRRLVRECHRRNIKVIVDIVTNHMGQMFFYDINSNGRPDEFLGGSGRYPDNERGDGQYRNPGGVESTLTRVTEYDPDFNDRGPVQGFTSLGPAGDAPIVFFNMPEIFRVVPRSDILASQAILARPEGYHRRGRITNYGNDGNGVPNPQVLLGDFPGGLKDVNTEDPRVRRAMIEAYWRWIELTDIDGFRIDTLKHVEHEFWQVFSAEIRRRALAAGKRNFLLFGEAFDGDDRLVGSFTNVNEMDSVFYFPQKYRIFDNIFQCGDGRTQDLEGLLRDRQMRYSSTPQPNGVGVAPSQILVNFMDNHDVSRFLYGLNPTVAANISAGGRDCSSGVVDSNNPRDVERFRPRLHAALTYLLTEDGIPCLYYGTEQDFRGGNDPANRERMWDTGFNTNERRADNSISTFGYTRQLLSIRRRYPAFRRGNMAVRWVTTHTGAEPDAGIMAYERVSGESYGLVVIHAKDGTAETSTLSTGGNPMTVSQPQGTVLVNVLGTEPRMVTVGTGGAVVVSLGPWQSAVFVPQSQVRP